MGACCATAPRHDDSETGLDEQGSLRASARELVFIDNLNGATNHSIGVTNLLLLQGDGVSFVQMQYDEDGEEQRPSGGAITFVADTSLKRHLVVSCHAVGEVSNGFVFKRGPPHIKIATFGRDSFRIHGADLVFATPTDHFQPWLDSLPNPPVRMRLEYADFDWDRLVNFEDQLKVYMHGAVSLKKEGVIKAIMNVTTRSDDGDNPRSRDRDNLLIIENKQIVSAPLSPSFSKSGDSGSPVFLENGLFVGVIVAGLNESPYSFVVKATDFLQTR